MPQPTPSDVHVDAILTDISVAYIQQASNYVAPSVFPAIPVDKQTNKYFTFTKGDWFRDEAQKRAPATESTGSGFTISTDSYSCDVFAFHKDVDDQTLANADNPLQINTAATQFVTQRMLQRMENQWTTDYFTTGVWATDVSGVSSAPGAGEFRQWNDYVNSDPVADVETAKETLLSTTGFEVNTMVVGYSVFKQLKQHPDIIDRIKYTSSENVTVGLLARLFEVERVLVCRAIKNTAAEGRTTSMSFVQGKSVLLCHVAQTPALLTPSAGYTFYWTGASDGLGQNIGISSWREQKTRSTRIEAQMAWDNKVVASDLGYFMATAVA